MYTGEWACLSTESILADSVSSATSLATIDISSCDDQYNTLIQQLTFMIPQSFLDTPIDELSVVRGASDYIAHLRQILNNKNSTESTSEPEVGRERVFVPQSGTDHMRYVQTGSAVYDEDTSDVWNLEYGEEDGWPKSPFKFPCPVFENQLALTPTASIPHPVALWQNKFSDTYPNKRLINQIQLHEEQQCYPQEISHRVNDDGEKKDPSTPPRRRMNSYTVLNDRTFSETVPYSGASHGFTNENVIEKDTFLTSDGSKRGDDDQFTRIKDPGLRECLTSAIYSSHGMASLEKYPVLSSLLDETGTRNTECSCKHGTATTLGSTVRKHAVSWVNSESLVSSVNCFDGWRFSGKDDEVEDDDDDVFFPSNQTEPDSTTDRHCKDKGRGTGLRRPKNGFIRFSVEYRKRLAKQHPKLDNREVSKMLGAKWRRMSHEEKIPYEMEFRKDIMELRSKHPEWRYAPLKQMETEHIEPMPSRLRPRDKLKKKFLPTIIKYGPAISERKQSRVPRKKRGKMAQYSTYNSFAWFQCKLCYRWRYVPCIDDGNLPLYQSMWFCHMNPDPTCNSCFAEGGLSINHTEMTSSVARVYQTGPQNTMSVFTSSPMTLLEGDFGTDFR
ncbi:uncharacterized protein LOC133206015 [Saccostrea echinata]|uniref:uncharacterized protein LOC133206015 n=1 Tax=Saccostrea echinata TaxID=191078 RepID=UPI002A7F9F64|nr:uncharacterized protein LOC133206015 [Saccostrea echinata]